MDAVILERSLCAERMSLSGNVSDTWWMSSSTDQNLDNGGVSDADAVLAQAVAEGARMIRPASDRAWGDRVASLEDPFGHAWTVAAHVTRLPH